MEKTKELVVLESISLTPIQQNAISIPTPEHFIKERPIRGGKTARYVEGGYVISRLNEVFGAANWQFEITDKEMIESSVAVLGKLTIIDHKNGYRVEKMQWGSHPRYKEIPIGDTLKAASTDSLKKCSTLLGIALDVYWQDYGENAKEDKTEKPKTMSKKELVAKAEAYIKQEANVTLLAETREKIGKSNAFTPQEKMELMDAINKKIKRITPQ